MNPHVKPVACPTYSLCHHIGDDGIERHRHCTKAGPHFKWGWQHSVQVISIAYIVSFDKIGADQELLSNGLCISPGNCDVNGRDLDLDFPFA